MTKNQNTIVRHRPAHCFRKSAETRWTIATRPITKTQQITENQEGRKKLQKNNAALIKAAPLFQLKFANLIADAKTADNGLIGSIEGLVYAPDLEQDFFSDDKNNLFPQTIKLSFQFTVAHTHPLGWKSNGEAPEQRQPNFPYNTNTGEE